VDEFADFLVDAYASGKIRSAGVSNMTAAQLVRLDRATRERGIAPIQVMQPQYNLLVRGIETDILPTAIELGIDSIVWGPLASG
jgi:aryl-alcohol dehydrogenase-like predicted oxidoreductase